MWFKLYKLGIQGKVLRVMKTMYLHVKSCVKDFNDVSNIFKHSVGLRQGEILSPILASLFLEDLEHFLQNKTVSGIIIDDIVSFWCYLQTKWQFLLRRSGNFKRISIIFMNVVKNRVYKLMRPKLNSCFFRRRGKLKDDEHWYYNGTRLGVTDDFNYLGCIFHYTRTFPSHFKHVVGKI